MNGDDGDDDDDVFNDFMKFVFEESSCLDRESISNVEFGVGVG